MSQDAILIYTDGGCDPNPGPGGWGVVLEHRASGKRRELHGGEPEATNNRMEMLAAIMALETLKRPCTVTMMTDSKYLQRGIRDWLPEWRKRDWRRKDGEPIKNVDLWKRLEQACHIHEIEWNWVKGHSGDPLNERADALATLGRRELRSEAELPDESPLRSIQIHLKVSAKEGAGGFAARLVVDGAELMVSGREHDCTANETYLRAATRLLAITPRRPLTILTRCKYLAEGAQHWIVGWEQRGWQTKDGKPVQHREAWEALARALAGREIEWRMEELSTKAQRKRMDAQASAELALALEPEEDDEEAADAAEPNEPS